MNLYSNQMNDYGYKDDGFEVMVINPEMKEQNIIANKFYVYCVRGQDKNRSFETFRRYSEFQKLRQLLIERWPGCFVASLPPKKLVGNLEGQFVQQRRTDLKIFMQNISKLKHFWYSQQMNVFLNNGNINQLSKQRPDQIIFKYEKEFTFLNGKDITSNIIMKISMFQKFINSALPMLDTFREMTRNMISMRTKYNQQYSFMLNMIPEYQKSCVIEYAASKDEQMLVFSNKKNVEIQQSQKKLREILVKKDYEVIMRNFDKEKRDLEGFQECLNVKKDFETLKMKTTKKLKQLELEKEKVMGGKVSLINKIKSQTKEDALTQIIKEIDEVTKLESQIILICDFTNVLLGYIEIDMFKKIKKQSYFKAIRQMSQYQLQFSHIQQQLWNNVTKCQILTNK